MGYPISKKLIGATVYIYNTWLLQHTREIEITLTFMPQSRSTLPLLLIGALIALIAAISLPSSTIIAASSPNILRSTLSRVTTKLGLATSNAKHLQANLSTAANITNKNMTRTPVYFLSHGTHPHPHIHSSDKNNRPN